MHSINNMNNTLLNKAYHTARRLLLGKAKGLR